MQLLFRVYLDTVTVNESKSKILVFEGDGMSQCNISLNGVELEVMFEFR